jgi:Cohesin domain/Dockerin type I domain
MRKACAAFVMLTVLSLGIVPTFSQSGGTFLIEKSVIANGGGSASGGTFALDGTIAESLAGAASSGGVFTLNSGFWASSAAPTSISGTITYGNAIGSPPAPRFVSNVTLTGTGSPNVMTTTAPPGANAGQYVLSGFGSGSYTVMPSKTGAANGAITSFDAGRVGQHVSGPPNPQLNPTQLIVADVSGNGQVTSFDAGMIAKFAASGAGPSTGLAGTWRFTPVNRPYATVTSSLSGEDYVALLMGEVSGNWANTGARPEFNSIGQIAAQSAKGNDNAPSSGKVTVTVPKLIAASNTDFVIPISIKDVPSNTVIGYEFDLRYDPSVIMPLPDAVNIAGTASRNFTPVVNASEPGLLRVVMYSPTALNADGILLNLRFTVVGKEGSVSPLKWERIMFNEGDPQSVAAEGQVEISAPN